MRVNDENQMQSNPFALSLSADLSINLEVDLDGINVTLVCIVLQLDAIP